MSDQMPAVAGLPRIHLRIEGSAVLVLCTVLFWLSGWSWWLFAVLLLTPDLAMAGYLAGPRVGAFAYNLAHNYLGPVLIGLGYLAFGFQIGLPLALIWAAHIGLDRMLGYGLKYDAGFGFTHLGRIGKAR